MRANLINKYTKKVRLQLFPVLNIMEAEQWHTLYIILLKKCHSCYPVTMGFDLFQKMTPYCNITISQSWPKAHMTVASNAIIKELSPLTAAKISVFPVPFEKAHITYLHNNDDDDDGDDNNNKPRR
jgi:hypothetical protein